MDARITSVQEANVGSALTADTSIGAGTIDVSDGTAFDESGTLILGSEIMPYSDVNEDTGIITLIGTLASTHSADDPVYVYPLTQERVAYLITGDSPEDEEGMAARIPHALWDKIPVGIRDWDNDEGEAVQADFIGDELVIMELVGQDPIVDATFVDPTTLPPNPSDGLPPSSSPTPTVTGGPGYLAVVWTGVTNADQVTYDVHISTTTGFTPSSGTLYGSVQGTVMFIRKMPDGTPLDYGTPDSSGVGSIPYYVKIVARDIDGSAAASTQGSDFLRQLGGGDLVVGSITAEHLISVLNIANLFIAGDPAGNRIELDGTSFRLINGNGTVVNFPTDGSDPTFAGNVHTGGLVVTDNAVFQGANNTLDKGAVLTLVDKQGDPSAAPTLVYDYENLAYDSALTKFTAGTAWNDATGKFYTINNAVGSGSGHDTLVEAQNSSGVATVLRTHSLTDITDLGYALGVAILGTDVWVCYLSNNVDVKHVRMAKYDLSTLTFQTSVALLTAGEAVSTHADVAFGSDGTNLLLAIWSGTGTTATAQIKTFNTSGVQQTSNSTTGGHQRGSGSFTWGLRGISTDGTDYWVLWHTYASGGASTGSFIEQYNAGTFAHVADKDVFVKNNTVPELAGLDYDGSAMHAVSGYNQTGGIFQIIKFSTLLWADGSGDNWYVAYEWDDATHKTGPSPIGSVSAANTGSVNTPSRRGRVSITTPSLPSGITKARIFAKNGSSLPASSALKRQSATSHIDTESGVSHIFFNYDAAGAAPDTNDFGGGTSTIIGKGTAITAPWEFGGDGLVTLPRITVAQRLASPGPGDIAYDEDLGGPSFYSKTGTGAWAPIASRGAISWKSFEYYTDFVGSAAPAETILFSNNGGTAAVQTGVASHPGIVRIATGSTNNANGNAGIRLGELATAPIQLGQGVVRFGVLVNLPGTLTLARIRAGLQNTGGQADPTAGYNFRWASATNSGKWQIGKAGTYSDAGITPSANQWVMLELVVSADATSCAFFINGVSAGSLSGTAETGAALLGTIGIEKDNTTTTSRTFDVDLMYVSGEFSVARF